MEQPMIRAAADGRKSSRHVYTREHTLTFSVQKEKTKRLLLAALKNLAKHMREEAWFWLPTLVLQLAEIKGRN